MLDRHHHLTMAAPLLEARGVRRKSKVQETPRVVHGFTWVDLHGRPGRRGVLDETLKHVNVTTRTTHPQRKHRVGALSRCHPEHCDTRVAAGHPRCTRVHHNGEDVGGSTTRHTGARRAPNHNNFCNDGLLASGVRSVQDRRSRFHAYQPRPSTVHFCRRVCTRLYRSRRRSLQLFVCVSFALRCRVALAFICTFVLNLDLRKASSAEVLVSVRRMQHTCGPGADMVLCQSALGSFSCSSLCAHTGVSIGVSRASKSTVLAAHPPAVMVL